MRYQNALSKAQEHTQEQVRADRGLDDNDEIMYDEEENDELASALSKARQLRQAQIEDRSAEVRRDLCM